MTRFTTLTSSLAAVLWLSSNIAHAADDRIAVLPVQIDKSAKGKMPSIIDDIFLTAVQDTSGKGVIGQDDINAMLGFEQQKSIVGCDEMSCIAEIGGALGVDRIIAAKVAVAGSKWVITAKLINIRAAKVESRASKFIPGGADDVLQLVPTLVQELLGQAATAATAPTPQAATRSTPTGEAGETVLMIQGRPSGAYVFINEEFKGVTPLVLPIAPGPIHLVVEKEGHSVYDEPITLYPGEPLEQPVYLESLDELQAQRRSRHIWAGVTTGVGAGLAVLAAMAFKSDDLSFRIIGGTFSVMGAVIAIPAGIILFAVTPGVPPGPTRLDKVPTEVRGDGASALGHHPGISGLGLGVAGRF